MHASQLVTPGGDIYRTAKIRNLEASSGRLECCCYHILREHSHWPIEHGQHPQPVRSAVIVMAGYFLYRGRQPWNRGPNDRSRSGAEGMKRWI